jgi:hypothetical protein
MVRWGCARADCSTQSAALALIEENGKRVDGAILNINVCGNRVYPAADALTSLGVPALAKGRIGLDLVEERLDSNCGQRVRARGPY